MAEVDERVACDDRLVALDPEDDVVRLLSRERLDSDGQLIPRGEQIPLDLFACQQPVQPAAGGILFHAEPFWNSRGSSSG